MFGWLKRKIVANEANKSAPFRSAMEWIAEHRRVIAAILVGVSIALRNIDPKYIPAAGWIDQIKVIVDSLAPGMEPGAIVLLVWSILSAKKKAKENTTGAPEAR